jgi:hypothetical protein
MTKDVKNILTISAVIGALAAGYFFVVQPMLDNNSMAQKYKGDSMETPTFTTLKDIPLSYLTNIAADFIDPVKDYSIATNENPKYLNPNTVKVKYL